MSSLFGVPVDAVYHVVFTLTNVLTPVLGGLAAVAGIILITIAVRLLVSPLTFRALRGQAAQTRLAPEVAALRQRYGKHPERLQRELTALYRREGTSVFAGFAPLLVQWPAFSVLYLLFRSPTVAGGQNRLLSHDLLGVPLGSHWLSGAGLLSLQGGVFIGVLALLAAACWLAARVARRALPQPALAGGAGPAGPAGPAAPGAGALAVFGKVAPYITVVIAVFAPLAGVIYLITSTGWSAAERLAFAARSRRSPAPVAVPAPVAAPPAGQPAPSAERRSPGTAPTRAATSPSAPAQGRAAKANSAPAQGRAAQANSAPAQGRAAKPKPAPSPGQSTAAEADAPQAPKAARQQSQATASGQARTVKPKPASARRASGRKRRRLGAR